MEASVKRLGAGFSVLGALCWLLWPSDWTTVLDGEAIYVFSCTLVFWVWLELCLSGAALEKTLSENDKRLSQRIAGYHAHQFSHILKEHDHCAGIDPNYLSEVSLFHKYVIDRRFFFSNKKLHRFLIKFNKDVGEFTRYFALNSAPNQFGSVTLQSVIPPDIKYGGEEIPQSYWDRCDKLNALATKSWQSFDALFEAIKNSHPEAFSEVGEPEWIREPYDWNASAGS